MLRVVIVDDEPWALKGLESIINSLDSQLEIVGLFENPIQALAQADKLRPDILFTDIRMPEMTGLDLIKAFRSLQVNVEAVIISAHRSFEVAQDALELEVRQYLLKPFSKNAVQEAVDRIIRRLDKTRSSLAAEREAVLKDAAAYPYCWVLAVNDPLFRPIENEAIKYTEYSIPNITRSYLCSSRQKYDTDDQINPGCQPVGVSLIRHDFIEIDAMAQEAAMSLSGGFRFSANAKIRDVQRYLYGIKDQKLDASQIANHFHLSAGYLSNFFKRETGQAMVVFLHRSHMHQAAIQLLRTGKALQEIAADLGYSDYNYFARLFKRFIGSSPHDYRQSAGPGQL